jgi:hypothetical protein
VIEIMARNYYFSLCGWFCDVNGFFEVNQITLGARDSVIEALCYKSEGRRIES